MWCNFTRKYSFHQLISNSDKYITKTTTSTTKIEMFATQRVNVYYREYEKITFKDGKFECRSKEIR